MSKPEVTKLHTLTGHRDCVYTVVRSSNNGIVFSAAGDGMVVSWDLDHPESGQLIARLPSSIYALHFHRASGSLLAGQNFEGIHVLDPENKKELGSLHLTKAAIFDIQSVGDFVFVAAGDGVLYKVRLSTLSVEGKVQSGEKSARSVSILEETGDVVVGYSDHWIRVFDMESLQVKQQWQAHSNSVFTVRFAPNGKVLLSGSRDARLKAWDVTSGYKQVGEIVAHLFAINHLDFSPDGKHFVTCSMDKSLKVWNFEELRLLKVIDRARHAGHGTSVNKVLWTSHHDQVVSASDDRTLSVWNIIF
jgi:WD40 repeat protein